MPGRNTGTIAFATVSRVGTERRGRDRRERAALLESLVPGTTVERYGRTWRLAKPSLHGSVVTGRIGFEKPGTLEEYWNESAQDFERGFSKLGTASRFAIDLKSRRIAFQLRSNRIKPHTFIGNFQALLNAAAAGRWRWKVEPEFVGMPWERWTDTVTRVTNLRIRLERPNPNFKGRKRVESLIEGTRSRILTLVMEADPNESIDVDDQLVREAIDHAREHGHVKAEGRVEVDNEALPVKWDSEEDGATQRRDVPVAPDTGEVPFNRLRREVATAPSDEALPSPEQSSRETETEE
ncbi:MAG TPA: hypothetical protein VHJ82_08110 [Actinomycetota bacterium]|nr:hypothetical protein [Actinomycetota bacterium]